ncbi:hypothetical protein SAMN05444581_1431 [Methylocapsa palsarum]|uniref:Uncharacterized protein n=1 Tax=Methylocapsa palsarum TaxID=1612308 RepID=A0A1I4DB15_9HYPH|nr:hypothetical protein SAMN05444581_1431 [Methylocapsa palsarum]
MCNVPLGYQRESKNIEMVPADEELLQKIFAIICGMARSERSSGADRYPRRSTQFDASKVRHETARPRFTGRKSQGNSASPSRPQGKPKKGVALRRAHRRILLTSTHRTRCSNPSRAHAAGWRRSFLAKCSFEEVAVAGARQLARPRDPRGGVHFFHQETSGLPERRERDCGHAGVRPVAPSPGSRPTGPPPLWGFGRDGACAAATEKDLKMSHSKAIRLIFFRFRDLKTPYHLRLAARNAIHGTLAHPEVAALSDDRRTPRPKPRPCLPRNSVRRLAALDPTSSLRR